MAKAVIFDMDGVLIDSELIYLEWLIDYLNQRGYIVDREQLEQSIGLSSGLTIELMEKIYGKGTGRALWEDFLKEQERRRFFGMLLKQLRKPLQSVRERIVHAGT